MNALKGQWVVTAGVLIGEPMPELTRGYDYTSEEYEADLKCEWPDITKFSRRMEDAMFYARTIMVPQNVNWVRVDFTWL